MWLLSILPSQVVTGNNKFLLCGYLSFHQTIYVQNISHGSGKEQLEEHKKPVKFIQVRKTACGKQFTEDCNTEFVEARKMVIHSVVSSGLLMWWGWINKISSEVEGFYNLNGRDYNFQWRSRGRLGTYWSYRPLNEGRRKELHYGRLLDRWKSGFFTIVSLFEVLICVGSDCKLMGLLRNGVKQESEPAASYWLKACQIQPAIFQFLKLSPGTPFRNLSRKSAPRC